MGVLLFYIAGLFLVLLAGFAVIDFMEWREKKRDARAREYRRAMVWAPKLKK